MIDDVEPELAALGMRLAIEDERRAHLTLHHTPPVAGLVVTNYRTGASTSIRLSREDRAALIRELIEIQESEGTL